MKRYNENPVAAFHDEQARQFIKEAGKLTESAEKYPNRRKAFLAKALQCRQKAIDALESANSAAQ